jgi:hypothetical protein
MTLSEKEVLDILNNDKENLYDNLGFILTVIRDNTSDDNTFMFLDKLVHRMWNERKK